MRVLMLSWEYPPRIVGGISRVVHDLAQKLGEKGNEIHVVTCWEQNTKEVEKDENVYVHRVHTLDVNSYNFIDWALHLNFAIIEHSIKLINETGRFDIIHAHDWIVAYAARTIKYSYHVPLVSTMHATESGRNWGLHNDTQRYINGVEWWLSYESWKVIVNSEYMRNEVEILFNLPKDKVNVIFNGVDLNKFNGIERDCEFRRGYAQDNEKIVFFVGRLVNEKGIQVLMDAIPKIINHFNDSKYIIAGKGPQFEYLKWKAAQMNISHKVHLTGYISEENLLKLYKCSDVAVFPSLYEPFGIVALEGMVAGVPVVVSDTGGLGEIVNHGIDGIKSYTGNSNSLADGILEILYNPLKAEEMKKNAFEKVNRYFNWDLISEQTINVYNNVLREFESSNWKIPGIKERLDGV